MLKALEKIVVNTSHPGKLAEFKKFFGCEISSTSVDLKEPDADALTVVQYKASQFMNVLIDDTSLDIEGEQVGVQVRWLLETLERYVGKTASFRCLLAIQRQDQRIHIYQGRVNGKIVSPRGESFGFNPFFLPDSASKTLAEAMPEHLNARYLAVQNFLQDRVLEIRPPLKTWPGRFQSD